MNNQILVGYVERIYLFARGRTYSNEEAEELAQEILYQACRSLDNLRDDSSFESWLFGLANNVLRMFRRKKGRENGLYVYGADLLSELAADDFDPNDELYSEIRRRLASLSSQYRQILIMHYYDGMSCKEIAEKLNLAEGTVKWRLSEGRSYLKKEWNCMNEIALKPKKLVIRITGMGDYNGLDRPFPWQFVSDAASQNILRHAYEQPKTIEELSILTGIPAYYVEDTVDNLVKREAMVKVGTNKYQTDFIIFTQEVIKKLNQAGQKAAAAIERKFWDVFDACLPDMMATGFYTAGRSEEELKWLLTALAIKACAEILNHIKKYEYKYQVKYDGNT